jgi:hypothetical protein
LAALGEAETAHALATDVLARRRRLVAGDRPKPPATIATEPDDHSSRTASKSFADTWARQRLFGDERPDMVTTGRHLAAAFAALGDHRTARDLTEETLTRRRLYYGDDHPHALAAAGHLAGYLIDLGHHRAAYDLTTDTSPAGDACSATTTRTPSPPPPISPPPRRPSA